MHVPLELTVRIWFSSNAHILTGISFNFKREEDCENHRVQSLEFGKLTTTTEADSGSGSVTMILICPITIVLDNDSYLFVVDSGNHRVMDQNANGFRCLVGCT
ncbi:unnamed protein product [Adineta ricciae]|uniref:Uncharacterized protein n=1 Tax=Adineta ricciae TaxID=249248 RepID=A0A813ULX9_ADIRI|nr:unnamed protein product [Adineta ricciae]